jgi:RNA polymerase sigma factor (sigma-70 family)
MSVIIDKEFCKRLFNSEVGAAITKTVAKKLDRIYGDVLDASECMGWGQLGVAMAMDMIDPERFVGETVSASKRVCSFLITKGRNLAIDEMRSAGVVGRTRKGRLVESPIKSDSLNAMDDRGYSTNDYIVDENAKDPAAAAEITDLVTTVAERLKGDERRVFEMAYVDGMGFPAIAILLGVTVQRVYAVHTVLLSKISKFVSGNKRALCPN